jgi:hypothetical protein
VAESLGNEEALSLGAVQFNGLELTECRRSNSNVDNNIQNRTGEALHILGLPGWHVREVNSANGSRTRNGNIHLLQVKGASNRFFEYIRFE